MAGLVDFEGGTYRDLNDVLINGKKHVLRQKKPFKYNILVYDKYCNSHFLLFILRYSEPSLYKPKTYFEYKAREKYTTPVYTKTLVCQTCARA